MSEIIESPKNTELVTILVESSKKDQSTQTENEEIVHSKEVTKKPETKEPRIEQGCLSICWIGFVNYWKKFTGGKEKRPKMITIRQMIWSWIGAFFGIGLVGVVHYNWLSEDHFVFIIGSFGASAVLIYGAPSSPMAQPRNFIGGHLVSAIVGNTFRLALGGAPISALGAGCAVAFAIVGMQLTITTHPPGGATALIAVLSAPLPWYGYMYVIMPVLTGTLIMLAVALVVNNMSPARRYPLFWFGEHHGPKFFRH